MVGRQWGQLHGATQRLWPPAMYARVCSPPAPLRLPPQPVINTAKVTGPAPHRSKLAIARPSGKSASRFLGSRPVAAARYRGGWGRVRVGPVLEERCVCGGGGYKGAQMGRGMSQDQRRAWSQVQSGVLLVQNRPWHCTGPCSATSCRTTPRRMHTCTRTNARAHSSLAGHAPAESVQPAAPP